MLQTAERDFRKYGGEVVIFTEQEGGSSGTEVSQQVVKMLAGHPVFVDIVSGQSSRKIDGQKLPGEAKVIRALPLAGQAEAGNVRIVKGRWNGDFLDEICAFPEFTNDDQVDGVTGAYNKLSKGAFSFQGAAEKTKVESQPERFGAGLALQKVRDRRARR
jgi:predicted phage terminase large subunit-like protein